MWQGMEDRNVSVAASLRLAELIRTASLKRIEGAGHYWIFDHIEEVLAAIKQAMLNNAPPPRPAHRVG